jgi:hypothetical protein
MKGTALGDRGRFFDEGRGQRDSFVGWVAGFIVNPTFTV